MNRHERRPWRRATLLLTAALAGLGTVAATAPPAAAAIPCQDSGFDLGLTRTDDTATPGTSASALVALVTSGTFSCGVTLTPSGLPAGVTAPPVTWRPGQWTKSIEFTTSPSTPLGRFPILITGTSERGGTDRVTFQLVVATVDEVPPKGTGGDFTMLASSTAGSAVIGVTGVDSAGPSTFVVRDSGFNDPVRFTSASGVPPGVTAQLGTGARFTPSATSPLGTFRITLTAANVPEHGVPSTVTLHYWLTIAEPPGFTLSLDPAGSQVARGGSVTTVVRQSALEGRSDTADLLVGALPPGVTAALPAPTVSSTAPATLTLHVSDSAATGTFPILVAATSFTTGLPERVTFTLTVT
jgi:hypothetical protein